jgi:hypothetical protein
MYTNTKVEAVGMTCSPHWRWNGVGFGRWVKQYLESIHRSFVEPMAYESFQRFYVCPGARPQRFAGMEPGTRNFKEEDREEGQE